MEQQGRQVQGHLLMETTRKQGILREKLGYLRLLYTSSN